MTYTFTFLIIPKEGEPFLTDWFDYPDKYIEGSTVFNLHTGKYTINGKDWIIIKFDHL